MIPITLRQIQSHFPCVIGWNLVFNAYSHLGDHTPFPLANVVRSNGMDDALWCLRCLPEYGTLWRLFAHRLACKAALALPDLDLAPPLRLLQDMAYQKVHSSDVSVMLSYVRELIRERPLARSHLGVIRNALRQDTALAAWLAYDADSATDEDTSAFLRLIGDMDGAINPPSRFRPEPTE